jgi:gamma-glutamyltranspeptidase/glutathione hydrolase
MSSVAAAAPFDRPGPTKHQSRSVVMAPHGMVATSQPLAAQAGLDVLKAGGNAIDAAIAANAVLGVVEPMSCGLGGDLFAIVWDAKTKKLYGLNASGRSPYALTRDVFREKKLDEIPVEGPLCWSVPGCVDGWEELRKKFGTRGYAEILAPAIGYAREGFPASEVIANGWLADQAKLAKWPDSARTFLIEGRAPRVGEVVRNPRLAVTLERIAQGGRDAFYRGEPARQIVAASQALGGYFALKDFEDHRSEWIEPVTTNYRGYDVWELPPNGQGIAALQMLNVLERHDLKALGYHSPAHVHLLIEAKKLAFADRAKFYADPAFKPLPVAEMISKEYAAKRAKLIDPARAAQVVPAGDPKLVRGDTIYLTVVDKDRNCVSFIQSIYHAFGSKVVPGETGFAMQSRGALFALDPAHLNTLEPHKRPFQTIIPGFVTKEGRPYLSFGVMGGDMQPQGHVQVLSNMIDFGMNVQSAGDAARVRHEGSDTPTGDVMKDGGTVHVESGVPQETVDALEKLGHKVKRGGGSFGGYQAILIDPVSGVLHGGTDPRKDGAAAGY